MKNSRGMLVGLLLGCANIAVVYAQPPAAVASPAAALKVAPNVSLQVQRAEASAQITAFATETMRSQQPLAEFSNWPLALRDALPYWLQYQPFEAWSPELRQFATAKFRALAADPAAKNKAAVRRWLQEKQPFTNAQMQFYLNVRFAVIAKDQNGALLGKQNQFVALTGRETRWLLAMARLISTLTPEQKAELFASKMHLPIARLNPQQKQVFEEIFGDNDLKIGAASMSIRQFPDAKIAIDFQFAALIRRTGVGETENFEVQIARPFDCLAD